MIIPLQFDHNHTIVEMSFVLIKDGKVFMDGKKEDILTDENLSELFSLPVQVIERNGYYQACS